MSYFYILLDVLMNTHQLMYPKQMKEVLTAEIM